MQASTTLIGDISIGHICQLDLMISTHVALPPLPDVPRHCGMKPHHEIAGNPRRFDKKQCRYVRLNVQRCTGCAIIVRAPSRKPLPTSFRRSAITCWMWNFICRCRSWSEYSILKTTILPFLVPPVFAKTSVKTMVRMMTAMIVTAPPKKKMMNNNSFF